MENMKKYYTGEVYGKNMWPAARDYSPHRFKYVFDNVLVASTSVSKMVGRPSQSPLGKKQIQGRHQM
jgi:hypothetical protein